MNKKARPIALTAGGSLTKHRKAGNMPPAHASAGGDRLAVLHDIVGCKSGILFDNCPSRRSSYWSDMRKKIMTGIAVIGLTLSIAGCGNRNHALANSQSPQPDASLSPAGLTAELFTATSAEYNSGQPSRWSAFVSSLNSIDTYKCMQADGYPGQALSFLIAQKTPASPGVDNTEFPDVARLKGGSLGLPAPAPASSPFGTNAGIPQSEQAAFNSDLQKCDNLPLPQVSQIGAQLRPIRAMWESELAGVDTNAAVVNATARWSTCVQAGGVDVSKIDDYFAKIDEVKIAYSQTHPNADSQYAPQVVTLVKLYGKCIGPVANAMDSVRLQDRAKLFDKYGAQIAQIEAQMAKVIPALSKEYGIS